MSMILNNNINPNHKKLMQIKYQSHNKIKIELVSNNNI